MSGEKGVNLKNKNYFEDLLYWTSLIRPHDRGRGSCLKLGGQVLNKRRKEVVWLDTQGSKSWVGNCPPCPPGSAVPACSWPKFLAKMQCLKCTNALRFQKTTFLFTCLRSTWRVFSCKNFFLATSDVTFSVCRWHQVTLLIVLDFPEWKDNFGI